MSDSLTVLILCLATALFLAWVIVLKYQLIVLLAEVRSLRAYLAEDKKPATPTNPAARGSDPWSSADVPISTS